MTVINWSAISQDEDAISAISPGNARPKIRIRPEPRSRRATSEVQTRHQRTSRTPKDAAIRSESTQGQEYCRLRGIGLRSGVGIGTVGVDTVPNGEQAHAINNRSPRNSIRDKWVRWGHRRVR